MPPFTGSIKPIMGGFIRAINDSALQSLQRSEQTGNSEDEKKEAVALTPEESIQKTKIICLECGQEFRTLSPKHLSSHGLTGRSYRQKYGIKMIQPLCAQAITTKRKKEAQKRGVPENLIKAIAEKKAKRAAQKAAKTKE